MVVINNDEEYKAFIRSFRIFRIKNFNKKVEIKINYLISEKNREELNDLIAAHNIKNRNERLEFVYDAACSFIDKYYLSTNICEFENDKCLYQKMKPNSKPNYNGCCGNCRYLKCSECTITALADKLYFCPFIKKRKKYYKLNDILLLRFYFSFKKKLIAKTAIYMTREESIKALKTKSLLIWSFKKTKNNL